MSTLNTKDFGKQSTKSDESHQNASANLFLNKIENRNTADIFGIDLSKAIVNKPIDTLLPYSNVEAGHSEQPFKVRDDEEMEALVADIKENGIHTPLQINKKDNLFMILSGHRRAYAAKKAGLIEVPCIINEYDDITAANVVVGSNLLNREKILPSERVQAYKLKIDVLKQQGRRTDLTFAQIEQKLNKHNSYEIVAEEEGVSRAQIQRYISLISLTPELLEMVDNDDIPVTAGVNISSLSEPAQKRIADVLRESGKGMTIDTSQRIKNLDDFSKNNIRDVINPRLPKRPKAEKAGTPVVTNPVDNTKRIVSIPFSLIAHKFSPTVTDEVIIEKILQLLDLDWVNEL
ncbi:MAG: ParB N-terminal domain-containing protein [Oscillospiraceae bacterium]|nr:ParB N-terminal domain-containing protein [Oscillospiraceae bacterium]